MKRILLTPFFVVASFVCVSAQTSEDTATQDTIKLRRTTLATGYVSLSPWEHEINYNSAFFNIHLRGTRFNEYTEAFKVAWSFEPGINILIPLKGKAYSYPMPYFKTGPEMKISDKVYAATTIGINTIIYEGGFFPIPFTGLNIFYLSDISTKRVWELETGFHTTIPFSAAFLFYITIGISFL